MTRGFACHLHQGPLQELGDKDNHSVSTPWGMLLPHRGPTPAGPDPKAPPAELCLFSSKLPEFLPDCFRENCPSAFGFLGHQTGWPSPRQVRPARPAGQPDRPVHTGPAQTGRQPGARGQPARPARTSKQTRDLALAGRPSLAQAGLGWLAWIGSLGRLPG